MNTGPGDQVDPDLWPCGLVVIDGSGKICQTNVTLRRWLGHENTAPYEKLRFADLLSRASRIYFETHLRPLLLMTGHFAEVSIELQRRDGTHLGAFLNGRADLSDGRMTSAHLCVFQNEQRQTFERELVARRRESEEFRSLVQSSPYAIVSVNSKLRIHAWNAAAEMLFGYSEAEAIGAKFDQLVVPPEESQLVADDLRRATAGEIVRREAERLRKDGSRIHVEKSLAAINDKTQEHSGFVIVYSDITARKASEMRIATLLHELNHRSKNLLSVVQIIARQTARRYDGSDFLAVFTDRLASLTSNQDLLIRSERDTVDLERLARAQFAHLIDADDARVTIGGPQITLNADVSQEIGMALFELVTNAAKYGALSRSSGAVKLCWTITEGPSPEIEMTWVESGGPAVTPPVRTGFGTQVTGHVLEGVAMGRTSREFAPEGFRWTLRAPYERLTPSEKGA